MRPARLHSLPGSLVGLGVAASIVVALGLALVAPPQALAFTGSKTSNGFIVNKESTDSTGVISAWVYYDYLGGSTWNPAYSATAIGSYRSNVSYGIVFSAGQGVSECVEIPLVDGYRCQMVVLKPATGQYQFAVLNEPLRVTLPASATVSIGNWESRPATVSLDTTLNPLQVTLASDWAPGLGLLLGLALFYGGWSFVQSVRRDLRAGDSYDD